MTGLQLAEAIRTRQPDIKIILATGYMELPSDARHDFPMLRKPFMQEELAAIVNAVTA